ncbi:MAG: integrin alpha [Planctomycetota bacterium]
MRTCSSATLRLGFNGAPGYVHLYSGKTGALLYRFDEADPGAVSASSVAGLGDLDHDGLQDFAIGNYYDDQERGHVMVHLGNDLFLCAWPRLRRPARRSRSRCARCQQAIRSCSP